MQPQIVAICPEWAASLEEKEKSVTIYCAICNERFCWVTTVGHCPRCGASAPSIPDALLNETLLLKDCFEAGTDATQRTSGGHDDLNRLIGSRLHVYRCDSLLGCGGMGWVYLAYHEDLERRCALKVLSPRLLAGNAEFVDRFRQEGRAAAALIHPNVVTTHAIGEDQGYFFLEMEFVAGRTLQQVVQDEGRLTPIRATALAAKIADGLAAAHLADIIHRDLKLDNVLLTHHGIPKIADFGLAKRVLNEFDNGEQQLAGTPHFMAPELFSGCPATHSSDVYALGVCYFLLLTGRFPFRCGSLEELKKAAASEPIPNVRDVDPAISLEMAECINLLMSKTPQNRPANAVAAAQLLHAVSGQVRDLESLLIEAFGNSPRVNWHRSDSRYALQVALPHGRQQILFLEPSADAAAERLLLFASVCCEARPEYYEEALRLNAQIRHGSLALREIDGKEYFVMVDTYPRATVDGEEVRRSVLEVAARADMVEKLLTGLDEN